MRDDIKHQVAAIVKVLEEVSLAIDIAEEQHPPIHSLHEAHSVILEELEEAWADIKINLRGKSDEERRFIRAGIRGELIHVAAMAVRAVVDCLDEDDRP